MQVRVVIRSQQGRLAEAHLCIGGLVSSHLEYLPLSIVSSRGLALTNRKWTYAEAKLSNAQAAYN